MDDLGQYAVPILIIIAVMAIFSPTRAVLAWVLGNNGPLFKVGAYALKMAASVVTTIFKDHATILKNFAPRGVVIKTMDKSKR